MANRNRGTGENPNDPGNAGGHGSISRDAQGRISIIIELRSQPGLSAVRALSVAESMALPGFRVDPEYEPVPMGGVAGAAGTRAAAAAPTYIVRGTVANEEDLNALRSRPEVAAVWRDTPIAPFEHAVEELPLTHPHPTPGESRAAAPSAITPSDCSPSVPKGTIADVAAYLGADQIWSAGFRGTGIVVGVLDSGITAQGRPVKAGETSRRIPRVTAGWPSDWGTESSKWGDHGNMCATDVLGMAPDAQLYDLRIAGSGGSPGTISRALQAFQWSIDRHRVDGTPHILTNSWGIFQESWDPVYARDPNHPFTRKVVEAVEEGIIVLFAAGNCGAACPDGRCGIDNGPGRSIWGANGHPKVMTVGAVNRDEAFVGYSSQGPAALDSNKPDFCSITHFTGYFQSDSGTSAATPIAAGVVALLKQGKPGLTPQEAKDALRGTAKDIGAPGFDQHSGAGILRGKAAFDRVRGGALNVRTASLFRYWNASAGDHFFTTNWNELGNGRYGWIYEGVQCQVYPTRQPNTVPLYRYWNGVAGDHFYTTNWNELGNGRYGYVFEGIQCWVRSSPASGHVPLYRYWNPRVTDHFYTTNWNELGPGRYGWHLEGVQCWVVPQPVRMGIDEVDVRRTATPIFTPEPEPADAFSPETFVAASEFGSAFEPEPMEFEEVGMRLVDSFSVESQPAAAASSFQTESRRAKQPAHSEAAPHASFASTAWRRRRVKQGDLTVTVEMGGNGAEGSGERES